MIKNWYFISCLMIGSIFATSAYSGVGDVYYCVVDGIGSFENEEKKFTQYQTGDRFIFKQLEKVLEFDQHSNLAILPIYPYSEDDNGIIVSTFPASHRVWFDGQKFTHIVSQSDVLNHFVLFATCSSF